MTWGSRALAGALLLAALGGAGSAEAAHWRTVAGWHVMKDEDGCGLISLFDGEGETDLVVTLKVSGKQQIALTNDNWSIEEDKTYPLSFEVNGESYSGDAVGFLVEGGGRRGFTIGMPAGFLADFAAGARLRVTRGGALVDQLSLKDSGAAAAALRSCTAQALREMSPEARRALELSNIPRDPFAKAP